MKATDLKDFVTRLSERELDSTVEVVVVSQGTMGGTPAVHIKNISMGFDWDNKRILISTETPVINLNEEDLLAIKKSVSQAHSFHTYRIVKPLMDEVKTLKNFISTINPELLTEDQKEFVRNMDKRKAS